MKLPRRKFLHLAAGAAALPAAARIARAQTYPSRPVRVIVPFAAGGPTDIFARVMSQKLSERLGKQFYVENIAGAGGNIGTGQAAKAAPDGYTLLFAFSSYVVNPTLFERVPYDPYKDFDSVGLAVTSTTVVSVNPSVPAKTISELATHIKANPGKFSFASGGTGTQSHLAGEQFRLSLGLDLVHVPFNGGGPAIASVLAGHTPISFTTPPPALAQIKEGKLRADSPRPRIGNADARYARHMITRGLWAADLRRRRLARAAMRAHRCLLTPVAPGLELRLAPALQLGKHASDFVVECDLGLLAQRKRRQPSNRSPRDERVVGVAQEQALEDPGFPGVEDALLERPGFDRRFPGACWLRRAGGDVVEAADAGDAHRHGQWSSVAPDTPTRP
jgi:tripartite tricarboxylate transporter family receptor